MLAVSTVALLLGAAGPVPSCESDGADFCVLDRPEDLAFVDRSSWLVVSQADSHIPLLLLDTQSGARVPISATATASASPPRQTALGAPDCPGPPQHLKAGGNDVRRVGRQLQLAVINGTEPSRIEMFALDPTSAAPRVSWRGCIPVPPNYALNDVALGPGGELYATHMFDRPQTPAQGQALRAHFLSAAPTGYAVRWTRRDGWTRVAGTDVSFANGIAVSADGHRLAISGTFDQAVVLLDRTTGATRRIPVALQPDNLTPLADGGFLVAGHTGVPVTGVDPCRAPEATPCGFPFAIAEITASGNVRRVFTHDGTRIPGASVAVLRGRRLYLGSAFGDRISVVELSRNP